MKTFDELRQIAGNRTIDISIDELKESLTTKIKVIKRTDKEEPKIEVISRSDKNNKIKIIKRNDTAIKNLNGEEK